MSRSVGAELGADKMAAACWQCSSHSSQPSYYQEPAYHHAAAPMPISHWFYSPPLRHHFHPQPASYYNLTTHPASQLQPALYTAPQSHFYQHAPLVHSGNFHIANQRMLLAANQLPVACSADPICMDGKQEIEVSGEPASGGKKCDEQSATTNVGKDQVEDSMSDKSYHDDLAFETSRQKKMILKKEEQHNRDEGARCSTNNNENHTKESDSTATRDPSSSPSSSSSSSPNTTANATSSVSPNSRFSQTTRPRPTPQQQANDTTMPAPNYYLDLWLMASAGQPNYYLPPQAPLPATAAIYLAQPSEQQFILRNQQQQRHYNQLYPSHSVRPQPATFQEPAKLHYLPADYCLPPEAYLAPVIPMDGYQLDPSIYLSQQQQLMHQQQQPRPCLSRRTSPRLTAEVQRSTLGDSYTQLKLSDNLLVTLPICTSLTRVRQAYGMDKVWLEEFEQLFGQLAAGQLAAWTLVEVEKNPEIIECDDIVGYSGRYIIRSATKKQEGDGQAAGSVSKEEEDDDDDDKCSQQSDGSNERRANELSQLSSDDLETNLDDCDSVAQDQESTSRDNLASLSQIAAPVCRRIPTRFRMFIDSAKVRFCCDHCGHGWTSMKGRVVFWYELFELIQSSNVGSSSISSDSGRATGSCSNSSSSISSDAGDPLATCLEASVASGQLLVGYCAYKLFGQQCDVCKIENRFERPMWYPEEVCKVLNNLYNKIGQVYFGFKMPNIDKQRRAGKPKTSHNISLCQACHDGVCTDRK